MPPLEIRLATPDDLSAINAIYNYYPERSTTTYDVATWPLEKRLAWFEGREPIHPVTVASRGGEVVGWGSLSTFRPRGAYRYTVENSLYVHPDHQRQGVGSALLVDQIARARKLGLHSILAAIDSEQTGSLALHRKHGFTEAARFRQVGHKFDRWLDSIFMQLVLE